MSVKFSSGTKTPKQTNKQKVWQSLQTLHFVGKGQAGNIKDGQGFHLSEQSFASLHDYS